ncbi:MAG: LPXTG cell wall anchor domain-containing protein, partial [Propionibacteriaceae bacterium]|nr:LPXTG cell wall anchor domain-containing protein [Propionibacteriaceae bacterium]
VTPSAEPSVTPSAEPGMEPSVKPGVDGPKPGGDPKGKRPLPRTGAEGVALPLVASVLAAGVLVAGLVRRRR